jgi:hypothetical protein
MAAPEDLTEMLDRVASQRATTSDVAELARMANVCGDGKTVQVGHHNNGLIRGWERPRDSVPGPHDAVGSPLARAARPRGPLDGATPGG